MQSNNSPVIPDNPVTALRLQTGEGYQTLLAPFWGGWGEGEGGCSGNLLTVMKKAVTKTFKEKRVLLSSTG